MEEMMAKIGDMTVNMKVIKLKEGEITLEGLTIEIAKRLYEMSRDGQFKISPRALTGFVGIDERFNKHKS